MWNTEADTNEPQIGGKDTCTPEHLQDCDIQPHSNMCQCVECKQLRLVLQENIVEKEENLVDWEDADKAW